MEGKKVKVEHNTCINTDHATTLLLLIIQGVQQNTFYFCFSFLAAIGRRKMFTLRPNAFYYFGNIWVQISSNYKRGCCIRSPLVTKLFEVVLLHEGIIERNLKNSSPWYTWGLGPHRVLAMSVHYFWRYKHFSEHHFHFWQWCILCSKASWVLHQ